MNSDDTFARDSRGTAAAHTLVSEARATPGGASRPHRSTNSHPGWLSDSPLLRLTEARIKEFVREREALFWVFVFPVLLAFALGIAFRSTSPERVRVAVEDGQPAQPSGSSSKLSQAISAAPGLQAVILPPRDAAIELRSGKVALIVRQGPGVAAVPDPPGQSGLEYQLDPTRPDSRTARLAVDDAVQRAFGRKDMLATRDKDMTEPGARYIDFLIPGLIGLNLMGSGLWGLGFSVVTARNKKLLKRFAATPMRRSHYLLSFMLSRLIFLIFEVAAVVGFGWAVFGVVVRGSLITLGIVSLVGSLSFAGIGLLVAARPKTIEGVSGMMNLVMLPMWLLSGTFFSYARFPDFLQPAIKALPLTALNDALRGVMNDGVSLAGAWPWLAVLSAWGLICFVSALKIFRWQ